MEDYGEDDDFDEDDEGGRRRPHRKLLKNIRNRISKSSLGSIGRSRSRIRNNDNDDDDSSSSSSSSDADFDHNLYSNGGGFLKLQKRGGKKKKKTSNNTNKRKKQLSTRSSSPPPSPPNAPKRNLLRRSIHKEHGGMLRTKASRSLRMKVGFTGSTKDDNNNNQKEADDVAMPLPGHPGTTPDHDHDHDDHDHDHDDTLSTTKRSSSKGNPSSATKGKKKRGLGIIQIRDALSTGSNSSSRGSRSRNNSKSRRRSKQWRGSGNDRSVDSPPSVASTDENSSEKPQQHHYYNQHQQLQSAAAAAAAPTNARGNSSSATGLQFFTKKDPAIDDRGFLIMEANSLDFYYQSLPWIIKSWIYFLTVLAPFTFFYYLFVGLFHSTNFHQSKILQKLPISNLLFGGLSCTWRTHFWARQALDARGVLSTWIQNGSVPQKISIATNNHYNNNVHNNISNNNTGSRNNKRLPRRAKSRDSASPGVRFSTAAFLRPTARRRTTMPAVIGRQQPVGIGQSVVTMGANLSKALSPSKSEPNHHHRTMKNNNSSFQSTSNHMRRTNSNDSNNSRGRGGGGGSRNNNTSSSLMMNGSSHQSNSMSVWDAEKILESAKRKSDGQRGVKKRPQIDKHASIWEIYDGHATEEKNSMLQ